MPKSIIHRKNRKPMERIERQINPKPKFLTFYMESAFHRDFKMAAAAAGVPMQAVLTKLVQDWIKSKPRSL